MSIVCTYIVVASTVLMSATFLAEFRYLGVDSGSWTAAPPFSFFGDADDSD